jgi:hypothetical protein
MKTVCVFHICCNATNSHRKFLNLKKVTGRSAEPEPVTRTPVQALADGTGCQECCSGLTRRDCSSKISLAHTVPRQTQSWVSEILYAFQ